MLMNDRWIIEQCENNSMITPYSPTKVRSVADQRVVSYGVNSFGYDITLGNEFKIFTGTGTLDVKNPNTLTVDTMTATDYYDIPAGAMILAVSAEKIVMPKNATGVVMGKSTYARLGILANTTPLEAGWHGTITLELTNMNNSPVRLYVGEGIGQILFFTGVLPKEIYRGNYNGQENVTLPRIKHPTE